LVDVRNIVLFEFYAISLLFDLLFDASFHLVGQISSPLSFPSFVRSTINGIEGHPRIPVVWIQWCGGPMQALGISLVVTRGANVPVAFPVRWRRQWSEYAYMYIGRIFPLQEDYGRVLCELLFCPLRHMVSRTIGSAPRRPFSKRMLRVATMVDYFVMVLYTFCWVFVPTGQSIGSDKLNKAREKLGPVGSDGCGTT
jgi:hypothetical protein